MNDRNIDSYISESKMTSNRGKFLFAAVVLCAALGYFAYMAFQGAMVYYYTVSEISSQPATAEGRTVRVSGKLKPGSFHRVEGSTSAHFSLVKLERFITGCCQICFLMSTQKLFLKVLILRGRNLIAKL